MIAILKRPRAGAADAVDDADLDPLALEEAVAEPARQLVPVRHDAVARPASRLADGVGRDEGDVAVELALAGEQLTVSDFRC